MVALAARPPLWVAAVLVGGFAIFHGHAHGTELPPGADAVAFSIGFVVATGLLHLAGISFGLLARWPAGRLAVRAAGGAIALAGVAFLSEAMSAIFRISALAACCRWAGSAFAESADRRHRRILRRAAASDPGARARVGPAGARAFHRPAARAAQSRRCVFAAALIMRPRCHRAGRRTDAGARCSARRRPQCCGALVAMARPLPRPVGWLIAAVAGATLGLDSPPQAISIAACDRQL